MNKKGLSAVVASLLIVLITIAAVLLVWNVVKKNLETNSAQLSQADCIKVEVAIDSCALDSALVSIAGSVAPTKLVVTFSDGVKSDVGITTSTELLVGGKATYTPTTAGFGATLVTVTPYIGEDMACGTNVVTATCSA